MFFTAGSSGAPRRVHRQRMAVRRELRRTIRLAAFWLVFGLILGGMIYALFLQWPDRAPTAPRIAQAAEIEQAPDIRLAVVSWYGPGFHGRRMANGRVFDQNDPTVVAHKTLPFGTRVRLTNPDTGASLVVTVQDRGPYITGRSYDVSRAAAERLDLIGPGVKAMWAEILGVKFPSDR